MHTTIKQSADKSRLITLISSHQRNKPRQKPPERVLRASAVYGSKSYRDGLQRAFNKAKEQVYFNPDMNLFVTLTYKGDDHSIDDVLSDMKIWLKNARRRSRRESGANVVEPKYIWIAEYQKRGSIHIHMICNRFFPLHVNSNGYLSISNWQKGFSSVLQVTDFDHNFRPYLYLFKYMRKSQRIGQSFVHTSRNLTNYTAVTDRIPYHDYQKIHAETTETFVDGHTLRYYRHFMQIRDTMQSPLSNNP